MTQVFTGHVAVFHIEDALSEGTESGQLFLSTIHSQYIPIAFPQSDLRIFSQCMKRQ